MVDSALGAQAKKDQQARDAVEKKLKAQIDKLEKQLKDGAGHATAESLPKCDDSVVRRSRVVDSKLELCVEVMSGERRPRSPRDRAR